MLMVAFGVGRGGCVVRPLLFGENFDFFDFFNFLVLEVFDLWMVSLQCCYFEVALVSQVISLGGKNRRKAGDELCSPWWTIKDFS